jgi:regulator of sigma E protease
MHTLFSAVILIIILGILVFVHELGHFAVAKFFGIRVDEFGMGFPPRAVKLFSRNGTDYTINWIPFGGFVKIYGEDSLEKNDPDFNRSMVAKAWWKQILVLIAGVSMNIVLAWVLFSGILMMGAPMAMSQTEHPELLKDPVLTVLEVLPNSPADTAGIKAGDQIIKATTGSQIATNITSDGFTQFIQTAKPEEVVTLSLLRGKEPLEISVTPKISSVKDRQVIGVSIDSVGIQPGLSFIGALGEGARTTAATFVGTFQSFGKLITGKLGINSLSGPVGLTHVVGDAQKVGFLYLVMLTAIISINLSVINILPFPALDGGRILFVVIEKIIRRPLPPKAVRWANGIGFALLILLMLVITVKDVIKLF